MQNILISKVQEVERNVKYVAKVSDYGLACMSPEALSGGCIEKSDVHSFGEIMLQTLCPRRRHSGPRPSEQGRVADGLAMAWKDSGIHVPEDLCDEAARWICKCVDASAENRPSFDSAGVMLRRLKESVERRSVPMTSFQNLLHLLSQRLHMLVFTEVRLPTVSPSTAC
eukprot:6462968-Amphidinium_carterae.1